MKIVFIFIFIGSLFSEEEEEVEKDRLKALNAILAFSQLNISSAFFISAPEKVGIINTKAKLEETMNSLGSHEVYLGVFKFTGSVSKSNSGYKSAGSCEFLLLKLDTAKFITEAKETSAYKQIREESIGLLNRPDKEDVLKNVVALCFREMFAPLSRENVAEESGTSYGKEKKKLDDLVTEKRIIKTTESEIDFFGEEGKTLLLSYSFEDNSEKAETRIILHSKEFHTPFAISQMGIYVFVELGNKEFIGPLNVIADEIFVFNIKKMFFFNKNWVGVILAIIVPLSVLILSFGFTYFGI